MSHYDKRLQRIGYIIAVMTIPIIVAALIILMLLRTSLN